MDMFHINEGGTADIQSVPMFGTDFLISGFEPAAGYPSRTDEMPVAILKESEDT
ncbi:hypothetical protein SAMN05444373_106113 [Thermoclostridium caenicola]|uniref:Uncharacterized protein n=1 Tax=Thermoclostridium caenicola TaxID=659425 RepID=A0A1M6JSD0_9FIRM|nr:hypothetical protein SAMN05444373_106113 [Thermoclostridium caenicola]